jgi:serine phosphatase RsbU (regulator of sigma subunit)
LIIITLSLIFLYIHFRSKRKSHAILLKKNNEIQAKNEELQGQNEEIRMQRDELEKQRNIANQQRNEIAVKNDEITSSIRYAKSIQSAVLPPGHLLKNLLTNYFILFKPKEIVSGDFYFFDYKQDKMIIAAVDCTGHGVPGAFMSLLGLSILNDISSEGIYSSDVILNRLRTRVIQALHQEEFDDENRDGMDISLVVWDLKTNELQYSGAYNPLYIVRNGKLIEYKPDRMTLGIQSKLDQPFKSHKVKLQKDDIFYLFTDGFADQISGHFNKKMTKLKFKQFLTSIYELDMQEQEKKLEEFYNDWKTGYEQVDDVLVMGFRV